MAEWEIVLSDESRKFLEKTHKTEEEIVNLIEKAGYKVLGQEVNIEIKKLKGGLEGLYTIKHGKLRILAEINFERRKIFVENIDWRGQAYK